MSTKTVVGVTALALGIGALIVNPRVFSNDGTTMLLSCNSKQMFLIPSDEMQKESGVSAGFYTPASFTSNLMAGAMKKAKKDLAGNPFASLGTGLLAMMQPAIQQVVESTLDDVCAGREPALKKIVDALQ